MKVRVWVDIALSRPVERVCVARSVTFNVWRFSSKRLPVPLSVIRTVLLCPVPSVTLAIPMTTSFFVTLFFLRDVTEISLWPLSVSVTVSLSVRLHFAPTSPAHETRTLAVVPDTFAGPADAFPSASLDGGGGGGVDAVVSVWSLPTNLPKSDAATAR